MDLRSLAPLGVALIWGLNMPVLKLSTGHLHPYAFNALRLSVSVLVLGLLDWRARHGERVAPTPWRQVVLVGLMSGFAYQVLMIRGVGLTSAGHAAVMLATTPLWTAIIGRVRGVERPLPWTWVGLGVAFAGTVTVVTDSAGGANLLGDALVLTSALAWAIGTTMSKGVLKGIDPLRLAYLVALLMLPLHWAVAWPHLSAAEIGAAPTEFWVGLTYSGVFSTGVAYVLWNVGLVAVGLARTTAYVNLVPVIATLVAWAALDESVGTAQATGGAVVIGGLLMVQRSQRT